MPAGFKLALQALSAAAERLKVLLSSRGTCAKQPKLVSMVAIAKLLHRECKYHTLSFRRKLRFLFFFLEPDFMSPKSLSRFVCARAVFC